MANNLRFNDFTLKNPYFDGCIFFLISSILVFNVFDDIFVVRGNFRKYPFELTHIVALLICFIILANIITKKMCKNNDEHFQDLQGKHFSNLISFTFCLSVLVDVMYWTAVYPNSVIHGPINLFDNIFLHSAITILFFAWILAKKQTTYSLCCNRNANYKHFTSKASSLLFIFVLPIFLITPLYAGWTFLGQLWAGEPIYTHVIDWHSPLTSVRTFTKAFIALSILVIAYNFCDLIKKCFRDDSRNGSSCCNFNLTQ
jgi:hypothetical protein